MAVKTYMMAAGNDGNFGALVDGVDQTAATRTDGWTQGKIGANFASDFDAGTKQATGTFTTTMGKPTSLILGTTANAFKTPAALSGSFAATNWTFNFAMRAVSAAGSGGNTLQMRVYKSVNADGSGATELTASLLQGNMATLTTTADSTVAITWNPGAITLNNEYLFIALGWLIQSAGSSNSCDALFRTGQASAGSRFVTPDFTATVATPKSDSDVNGTVTETASPPRAQLTGTEPTGTETELATPIAQISADEPTGAETETADYRYAVADQDPAAATGLTSYNQLASGYATYNAVASAFATYNAISSGGGAGQLPILTESAVVSQPPVSVPASDVNSTTTETATPKVSASAADANATTTEGATITVQVSVSDVNGTVTETVTFKNVLPTTTDANGTTTESTSLITGNQVNTSDTNSTTTESVTSINATLTISDTGITTDTTAAAQPIAKVTVTDANGTVTESTSLQAGGAISTSDSNGTTSENTTVVGRPVAAEIIVTIENASTASLNTVNSSDSANGVDAINATSSALTSSDINGTTAEIASGIGKLTSQDNGSATDSASNTRAFIVTPSDAGIIVEAHVLASRPITNDNGIASETVTPNLQVSDFNLGIVENTSIELTGPLVYATIKSGTLARGYRGRSSKAFSALNAKTTGATGRVKKTGTQRIVKIR